MAPTEVKVLDPVVAVDAATVKLRADGVADSTTTKDLLEETARAQEVAAVTVAATEVAADTMAATEVAAAAAEVAAEDLPVAMVVLLATTTAEDRDRITRMIFVRLLDPRTGNDADLATLPLLIILKTIL